ncbi:hypothetical protein NLJ89_g10527 [Agrocybe chaxingu]|uniref:Uncharacterized protein n=1 Tax=Agrocybe chaxingu TaxID=84603 RepID=A0A9W8MQ71_9AGAR|nr:hypothetical protein NLJ89_g10527 [Agrocybe chaxingu]
MLVRYRHLDKAIALKLGIKLSEPAHSPCRWAHDDRAPRKQPPPESESDEAKASHQKKSPHTKRTVKKGRTTYTPATDNGPDTPAFLPPHAKPLSTDVPPAESHHHAPTPQTQPEPDAVTAQAKHLESLLDSVLATLVIIQAATNTAVTLSNHSRQALKLLNTLLPPEDQVQATSSPTPPVPTSEPANHLKQSYADAAKPCQVTPNMTHHARSSPAGATACHRPSAANQRPRHQHRHSTSRLIASWDGHPVPQSSSSLSQFVRNLNNELSHDRNPAA